MSVFDLLFILVFLTTIVVLVATLVSAVRGHPGRALSRGRALLIGLAAYLAVVTLVSLVLPRRVVALGSDECSDDWCIAVTSARPAADTGGGFQVVFRVSSRARRVSQRERFVVAYVQDREGHRYDAERSDGQAPFDVLLGPGASVLTTRVFRVPRASVGLGVVVAREGNFDFPGCCIVGEGPFRKPPIVYAP